MFSAEEDGSDGGGQGKDAKEGDAADDGQEWQRFGMEKGKKR